MRQHPFNGPLLAHPEPPNEAIATMLVPLTHTDLMSTAVSLIGSPAVGPQTSTLVASSDCAGAPLAPSTQNKPALSATSCAPRTPMRVNTPFTFVTADQ